MTALYIACLDRSRFQISTLRGRVDVKFGGELERQIVVRDWHPDVTPILDAIEALPTPTSSMDPVVDGYMAALEGLDVTARILVAIGEGPNIHPDMTGRLTCDFEATTASLERRKRGVSDDANKANDTSASFASDDPGFLPVEMPFRAVQVATLQEEIARVVDETIADFPDHWSRALVQPVILGWFIGRIQNHFAGAARPEAIEQELRKRAETQAAVLAAGRAL